MDWLKELGLLPLFSITLSLAASSSKKKGFYWKAPANYNFTEERQEKKFIAKKQPQRQFLHGPQESSSCDKNYMLKNNHVKANNEESLKHPEYQWSAVW